MANKKSEFSWNEWLFDPVQSYGVFLCRIAFGFSLFAGYIKLWPERIFLFGASGLAGKNFYDEVPSPYIIGRMTAESFNLLKFVGHDEIIQTLFILMLISSFCFMIGFFTKTAGWVSLILHTLFFSRANYGYWGWAEVIKPFMIYILLSTPGAFWAVDSYLEKKMQKTPPLISAYPVRLMQVHVCIMYFVVAWARIDNAHWRDGSMLYRILVHATFSRWPPFWEPLKNVLPYFCHAAWAVELVAPFLLLVHPFGKWVAITLVFMHLGLEAFSMVGYWNLVMIAALSLFIEPLKLQKEVKLEKK